MSAFARLPEWEAKLSDPHLSRISIMKNVGGCQGFAAGRAPNFVLLDFVDKGHGLDAVNQLNGLA